MATRLPTSRVPGDEAAAGAEGWRFARRPRWVALHLLVLALVVLMVNLGFWQLRRLDEKRDRNARIEERAAAPAAPVGELLAPGAAAPGAAAAADGAAADAVEYRPATATGRYVPADQVLVRSRSHQGRPGFWVLTPLLTGEGAAVVVNRGWVPFTDGGEVTTEAPAAPRGTVTASGLLQSGERRGRLGPRDPAEGRLDVLSRVDLARLEAQVDYPLYPAWLRLEDQDPPPQRDLPVLLDPPATGEGPHLSYALQWFAFSAIATVGWPVLLRRRAHRARASATLADPAAAVERSVPPPDTREPTRGRSVT